VGAGPIGLSAILGAKLFSPSHIVAIDLADARLDAAKRFGADVTVNNGREDAVAIVKSLTDGLGADVAIEAVGVPASFEVGTELVRPVVTWRTSASTASRRRSTSSRCGSATSP
jgi:alcohol dehydrogenase